MQGLVCEVRLAYAVRGRVGLLWIGNIHSWHMIVLTVCMQTFVVMGFASLRKHAQRALRTVGSVLNTAS